MLCKNTCLGLGRGQRCGRAGSIWSEAERRLLMECLHQKSQGVINLCCSARMNKKPCVVSNQRHPLNCTLQVCKYHHFHTILTEPCIAKSLDPQRLMHILTVQSSMQRQDAHPSLSLSLSLSPRALFTPNLPPIQ